MSERARRIEEAARALLSTKEAEIAKCRADNADTPDLVCDWCREEEEQIAPLRAALALPVEEPAPRVSVERAKREAERMRVVRFLRDAGWVAGALSVQAMTDEDPTASPPRPAEGLDPLSREGRAVIGELVEAARRLAPAPSPQPGEVCREKGVHINCEHAPGGCDFNNAVLCMPGRAPGGEGGGK